MKAVEKNRSLIPIRKKIFIRDLFQKKNRKTCKDLVRNVRSSFAMALISYILFCVYMPLKVSAITSIAKKYKELKFNGWHTTTNMREWCFRVYGNFFGAVFANTIISHDWIQVYTWFIRQFETHLIKSFRLLNRQSHYDLICKVLIYYQIDCQRFLFPRQWINRKSCRF